MFIVKSNLQSIIDEKGLSVLKVSKDIGYRYETVRQLYNDDLKTFPKELILKLCTYLKVTPGDIIILEENPDL